MKPDQKQQPLLIQKYAPATFEELKLPQRLQDILNQNIDRVGYNLLLFGTPGTGKTTTARLLTKGHETMYLSGSNDFLTSTMREQVYPFISSKSATGRQKTLVIDEFENISKKLQESFKIITDKSPHINFIFITNEVQEIIPALYSRCTKIEYNFSLDELNKQRENYIRFIAIVLSNEKMQYTNDGVAELYKIHFPDFRVVLVAIQTLMDANVPLIDKNAVSGLELVGIQDIELYKIIDSVHDSKQFYEKIVEYKGKEKNSLLALSEPYFKYLNDKGLFDKTLKAGEIVAKWSNIYVTTFNKFTTFFACVTELKSMFK